MNRRGLQRVQSLAEGQPEDLLPQSYAGAEGGAQWGVSAYFCSALERERERRVAHRSVCIAGFRVCVGVHGGPRAWWGGNPSFVSKQVEYTLSAVNEGSPQTTGADGWICGRLNQTNEGESHNEIFLSGAIHAGKGAASFHSAPWLRFALDIVLNKHTLVNVVL